MASNRASSHQLNEEEIDWPSMDSVAPNTAVSQELARESLMAISQSLPENNLASTLLPVSSTGINMANGKENGEAEKYRSKLISISYTQSPDVQPPPS